MNVNAGTRIPNLLNFSLNMYQKPFEDLQKLLQHRSFALFFITCCFPVAKHIDTLKSPKVPITHFDNVFHNFGFG